MGKRNIRVKKYREPITKSNIMAKVLPNYLTIVESREKFVENLKGIFLKSQKEFGVMVQSHLKHLPIKSTKRQASDSFTRSDFHYHDESGEFFHIYQVQFEHFITWLTDSLQDVFFQNRQIMKICIRDSESILQNLVKETENLTYGIFDRDQAWKDYSSTNWFKERVLKSPIVQQFFNEENFIVEIKQKMKNNIETSTKDRKRNRESQDLSESAGVKDLLVTADMKRDKENKDLRDRDKDKEKEKEKEREKEREREKEKEKEKEKGRDKKRAKGLDSGNIELVDVEVEEFRKKLDSETIRDVRERPYVTLDWIAGIKKKLVRG